MSFLYIGTFGSFIGFSFAFGQVLQINFLAGGDTAAQASLHAAQISFLGPLLGSISRPFGGKLADRIGGRQDHPLHLRRDDLRRGHPGGYRNDRRRHGRRTDGRPNDLYVVGFIVLFILSGIGNGSTYKMIPSIFEAKAQGHDEWSRRRRRRGRGACPGR